MRFGAAKQFVRLGDSSVLDRSVAAARARCAGVVVVLPASGAAWTPPPGVRTVAGGATRSDSVRAGLGSVPDGVEIVVVHDAARPLATPALFERVIDAVRAGADAAVPAVAIPDTVKRVRDGHVVETVPRDDLVAVQTPQAFRRAALDHAHTGNGIETDDAALVEAAGGKVVIVPGEPRNLKLTHADDLDVLRAMLDREDV